MREEMLKDYIDGMPFSQIREKYDFESDFDAAVAIAEALEELDRELSWEREPFMTYEQAVELARMLGCECAGLREAPPGVWPNTIGHDDWCPHHQEWERLKRGEGWDPA